MLKSIEIYNDNAKLVIWHNDAMNGHGAISIEDNGQAAQCYIGKEDIDGIIEFLQNFKK